MIFEISPCYRVGEVADVKTVGGEFGCGGCFGG